MFPPLLFGTFAAAPLNLPALREIIGKFQGENLYFSPNLLKMGIFCQNGKL